MSSESLAAFRRHAGTDLAALAEEHMKHDLLPEDRQKLESASKKFSTWAIAGSLVGLGLGAFLAYRLRAVRKATFDAFRATEKPTHVQFKDGRIEPIPDVTPLLQPTPFGDVATYFFFGTGGLFIGGELGGLGGAYSAKRTISSDSESRMRIEKAFRNFRADVLRKQAQQMQKLADQDSNTTGVLGIF